MKNGLILLGICFMAGACIGTGNPGPGNETIAGRVVDAIGHEPTGNFGELITEEGAIPSTEVIEAMGGHDSLAVKVRGEVVEVCQNKGCWMTMNLGNGQEMRITFKDYAFFVPKSIGGKQAIMEGVVKKGEVDVETLQHYAKDAGKSKAEIEAITSPEESYTFEAKGVIIKES